MTGELYILSATMIFGVLHLLIGSGFSLRQRGVAWAAGPRDTSGRTLTGTAARFDRAIKNFLETLPFFIAAVLIAHLGGTHNELSQWGCLLYLGGRILYVPAYLTSIWYFRTVFWAIAMAGLVMVLLAPFFG